tara:strand:+ start:477 stop:686 length:210 start_codon:yes stop_codon:yes gene_type:complete
MKKNLNQKLISLIEYYNLINANFLLSKDPIKRSLENTNQIQGDTKLEKLSNLKKKNAINQKLRIEKKCK